MKYIKYLFLIVVLTVISCDEGVTPEKGPTGFKGTITFLGEWPDSIKQSRIVLFEDPLNSVADFNAVNLKFASIPLPLGVSTYSFNTTEIAEYGGVVAGDYSYLAVAQSTSEELSLSRSAWIVSGLYSSDGNTPSSLNIPENTLVEGVNITCDFNNPPPQPPSK